MSAILRNPEYTGQMVYGRTRLSRAAANSGRGSRTDRIAKGTLAGVYAVVG